MILSILAGIALWFFIGLVYHFILFQTLKGPMHHMHERMLQDSPFLCAATGPFDIMVALVLHLIDGVNWVLRKLFGLEKK